ncbi:MAG: transglutaminase family protein [Moraxella sp.]
MTAPIFEDYALGKKTLSDSKIYLFSWRKKLLALPAYHWLLMVFLLVLIPHLSVLPMWLTGWTMLMIVLQVPVVKLGLSRLTSGRLKRIFNPLKIFSLFVISFFVWINFNQSFSVEFTVGLLLAVFSAKICEFYNSRDGYILLNLSLFILATAFLLRQDIGVVLIGLPVFFATLIGFIALNDKDEQTPTKRLNTLGLLVLPALPLLVVLFVFFPRIPPLWSLPISGDKAETGVSETMSPGDFSNLSRSSELAFRVEFLNTPPSRFDMYWRGLVYESFDGATWRMNDELMQVYSPRHETTPPHWAQIKQGGFYDYRVILEPTQQYWLFALDYPIPYDENYMYLTNSFTLQSLMDVTKQLSYTVHSYPDAVIGKALDANQRQINLEIPEGNPQSQQFAQKMYEQSGHDPEKYVQNIQTYIQAQGFKYTLSPPRLHNHRIDEFLFDTKAGFCEHYASSFTFLMRAAGIPARVVGGYQGGELGADGKSWEVRQMDAHAWSEIWLENKGWVRIDPTAFIAPDRIENGMNNTTQKSADELFGNDIKGKWYYQQFRLFKMFNRYSDQISYYWQKQIVGFNQDKQKNALSKWFNIHNIQEQFVVLITLLGGLIALFVFWVMQKRKKRYHPLDLPLMLLSKKLTKVNPVLAKATSEPYLSWLDRVGKEILDKKTIQEVQGLYRQYRYGQHKANQQTIKKMNQLTKEILNSFHQKH